MQNLSRNQNRQKFSRKVQRNYGRGQWHDRKPAVSVMSVALNYCKVTSWNVLVGVFRFASFLLEYT